MMELIAQNMAPIIFTSLVIFLLLGYPVAFSLAANGLIFFVIGVWLAPWSNGQITLAIPSALPSSRSRSTKAWVEPESNHTSRMSKTCV